MKLQDIGEFGFIERLSEQFNGLLRDHEVGIGDDCAVYPGRPGFSALMTTDLLVENIHFLKDKVQPEDLGYKSLAVSLSDIAAMGGKATGSYLSVAIPESVEIEWLDRYMHGYKELSKKYNVPLMGGDTTRSPGLLVINVCVTGEREEKKIKRRNTAVPGDILCTTGFLGDSPGGLQVLLDKIPLGGMQALLVQRHHRPEPSLKEGYWLSGQDGVHAMLDISDGIDSDIQHIMKASGISADIFLEKLPLSEEFKRVAWEWRWNVYEMATTGGEDYELLCTVDAAAWEKVSAGFLEAFGKPLYAIGKITTGNSRHTYYLHGREVAFDRKGYNHFPG